MVAQALCLTIFNLSPTQKTCHFTDGNKASVCGRRQPHSCLAFTVATRHFSCFPFARRRRLRRCADSVCDKLTRQGTVQMQPSALPVDHYSWKPRSICSSGRHHHACCACRAPAVPERPLPAACRRTSLLLVICTCAAAFKALPSAYSDCACLPVVPETLRLAELPDDAFHRVDHPSSSRPHRCSG